MVKDRAVAMIIDKKRILLIHRYKRGEHYYVFPGGSVKEGEIIEEACIREVKEETGLDVVDLKKMFEHIDEGRRGHYFLVHVTPGRPSLGGPELERQTSQNRHLPIWIPIERLAEINLLPEGARRLCIEMIQSLPPAS